MPSNVSDKFHNFWCLLKFDCNRTLSRKLFWRHQEKFSFNRMLACMYRTEITLRSLKNSIESSYSPANFRGRVVMKTSCTLGTVFARLLLKKYVHRNMQPYLWTFGTLKERFVTFLQTPKSFKLLYNKNLKWSNSFQGFYCQDYSQMHLASRKLLATLKACKRSLIFIGLIDLMFPTCTRETGSSRKRCGNSHSAVNR